MAGTISLRPAGRRARSAAGTAAGPAHPDGGIHPDRPGVHPPVETARRVGMARRAYVATVVLEGAANGTTISGQDPLEPILIELFDVRGRTRPPHHRQLEPGGRQADRNRAACRRPSPLGRPRARAAPATSTPLPTRYARPCSDGHGTVAVTG